MKKIAITILLLATSLLANTPGAHTVTLTWIASATPGVTYNIYRGNATGVCTGTVTPYATGISGTTWTDTSVTNGTTYYYNVSAVGSGGESTCDGQVQIAVPSIQTQPPTTLSGTIN